jgi:acyl carrier protein
VSDDGDAAGIRSAEVRTEADLRNALRHWILRASPGLAPEELTDATPIIERGILKSIQVMDLLLTLEKLLGRRIEAEQLRPGVFRSIDAIVASFFVRAPEPGERP